MTADMQRRDDGDRPASAQGSSGGNVARDVGTRDEEKSAGDADPEPTGVTKSDKVQPNIPTRADNEGANAGSPGSGQSHTVGKH